LVPHPAPEPQDAYRRMVATTTIAYHDRKHPSHLILPILSRR